MTEHEKRLDVLRRDHDDKREFLQQLQIEHNSLIKNTLAANEPVKKSNTDHEIIEISDEIDFLEKELETINSRKKKIHLVSD